MRFHLIFLLALFLITLDIQAAPGSGADQLQLQNSPAPVPQQPLQLEETDIRDIRGPVPIEEKQNYILFGGLALAALLIMALLLFYFLKRKKKSLPAPDPGVTALAELKEARSLMEQGKPLFYADRLSDIVRRYIEKRFQIHSTRQTTSEFLRYLAKNTTGTQAILATHRDSLQQCLEKCDMAKFAHSTPGNEGMEEMEASAHHFVTTTTPSENTQGKE